MFYALRPGQVATGIARMNALNNGTAIRDPMPVEEIDAIIEEVAAVENGEITPEIELPIAKKCKKKKR